MSKKLKKVRVLLGCNRHPRAGFINVDIHPFPGVDVVTDLNERWPWDDNSVDEFLAVDIIEHLKDPIHTFNESWRCLRPGGVLHHLTPSTDGRGAHQDPTHVSFFNSNSWAYYQVNKENGKWVSHPWRSQYSPYLIKAAFDVKQHTTPPDGALIVYEEVKMQAVKEPIYNHESNQIEA